MAEHLTTTEVRNYPIGNGETADLIALIDVANTAFHLVRATRDDVKIGDSAYVDAMGNTRRGVVVKLTKTKVYVAFTTQGAVDEDDRSRTYGASYYTRGIRVQTTAANVVMIEPPAAEPETPAEAEEFTLAEREDLAQDFQASGALDDAHAEAIAEDQKRTLTRFPLSTPATGEEEAYVARKLATTGPVVTVTGAIVNQDAMDAYDGAYRVTGDRESALGMLQNQAMSEDWQRLQVSLAGQSWATHFAKFDGTVLPRQLTLHSQGGKVVLNSEDDEEIEMSSKAMHEAKALAEATKIRELAEAGRAAKAETEDHTGSTVVRLLEKVWGRIRENHPELPEVVIITGTGQGVKWGHFRADGWKVQANELSQKHELFLAGEALAKGSRQVLQTMIHEAAHTLSRVRGITDTSRQGRWHNKEFKKAAEELGLEHKSTSADSSHGYSFVTLKAATTEKYSDLLEELDREIKLTCHLPSWLGGSDEDDKGGERMGKAPEGEGEEKKTRSTKAVCTCEEPNIIRLSDAVLELAVVRCDGCGDLFQRERG